MPTHSAHPFTSQMPVQSISSGGCVGIFIPLWPHRVDWAYVRFDEMGAWPPQTRVMRLSSVDGFWVLNSHKGILNKTKYAFPVHYKTIVFFYAMRKVAIFCWCCFWLGAARRTLSITAVQRSFSGNRSLGFAKMRLLFHHLSWIFWETDYLIPSVKQIESSIIAAVFLGDAAPAAIQSRLPPNNLFWPTATWKRIWIWSPWEANIEVIAMLTSSLEMDTICSGAQLCQYPILNRDPKTPTLKELVKSTDFEVFYGKEPSGNNFIFPRQHQ